MYVSLVIKAWPMPGFFMRAAALSESSYSRFRRCDMGAGFRFIHNGLRQ